jgi:quinol monooxygenase YgiN
LLEQAEKEPGTLLYIVQRSKDDDSHVFWTSELYADDAALQEASRVDDRLDDGSRDVVFSRSRGA